MGDNMELLTLTCQQCQTVELVKRDNFKQWLQDHAEHEGILIKPYDKVDKE